MPCKNCIRPSLCDLILIVLVVLILITLLEEEPRLLLFLVSLAFDLLPIILFVVVVRVEPLGKKVMMTSLKSFKLRYISFP